MRGGNLIVISGPSGAGKSTIMMHILRSLPNMKFSVSHTTRVPRGEERDGVEYFFTDRPGFESLIKAGEFLEWAEVHGNYYGTSRSRVYDFLRQGNDVILDIDVHGARSIKQTCSDAVAVFILPPSFESLRERLLRRELDDENVIEKRLNVARKEIGRYTEYDYLIVNNDLEKAKRELEAIIVSTHCRMKARRDTAVSIIETFGGIDDQNT